MAGNARNCSPEASLRVALHFGVVVFAPHEALDRENGVFGVYDGLVAGNAPHQPLIVLYRHHRGHQALAFCRGDDGRFAARHDRRDGIGGAQVNANDFSHENILSTGRPRITRTPTALDVKHAKDGRKF